MKKALLIGLLVGGFSLNAAARDKHDGCGLGWEVTDKKTYTATTTRGSTNSVVPPAFGMTTGTLGCEQLEIGANDKESLDYVATNFDVLKSELAMGRGEYVEAVAQSFGCADTARAGAAIQESYSSVVAPAANAVELHRSLKAELAPICG